VAEEMGWLTLGKRVVLCLAEEKIKLKRRSAIEREPANEHDTKVNGTVCLWREREKTAISNRWLD
jgi:hypothetical protein